MPHDDGDDDVDDGDNDVGDNDDDNDDVTTACETPLVFCLFLQQLQCLQVLILNILNISKTIDTLEFSVKARYFQKCIKVKKKGKSFTLAEHILAKQAN